MNLYVITGAVLACWAVLIALLGMRGFPRNRTGERAVIAITSVLFLGAVGSAIGDQTKVGERHGPEVEEPAETEKEPADPAPTAPATGEAPAPEEKKPAEEKPAGGGKASDLALAADPTGNLKFDKAALDASAGAVTIVMTNPSPVPHNVSLRGDGVDEQGEVVSQDGKSTVKAEVKAGTYEFYCSVPGHEQGGMKGTLTVK